MLAPEVERVLEFELRASWQAKVLVGTRGPARAVIMSMLAHAYEHALVTLCAAVFPDFDGSMPVPYLESCAKIAKTGAVCADVRGKDGKLHADTVLFQSDIEMRDACRKLADRLKLPDDDRVEFFKVAQRWLVADRRLDPTFDPRDPDAKRLVH